MAALPASVAQWRVVCPVERVVPDRGVAALVDGQQVAVFVLSTGDAYAIANRDPFSGADVLSRGIIGDAGGVPTVASPVYKQRFDLRSGRCLDDETIAVATWPVRITDGCIEVGSP